MRHDSPLEENIDTTNKPAATAVKKQFKVPKGPYRTPAGFDNPKELKDDLADFGFSNKRVRELIGKHEPVVDGQGQIPQHYVTVGVEGDNGGAGAGAGGNGAGRERGQRGVANKVKYDHLVLTPESSESSTLRFHKFAGQHTDTRSLYKTGSSSTRCAATRPTSASHQECSSSSRRFRREMRGC